LTILADIKTLLEVDVDETIYDDALLGHINTGMVFLQTNAIPVGVVSGEVEGSELEGDGLLKSGDYETIKEYLYFHCLARFDGSVMAANRFTSAYSNWIENQLTVLLYSLKARYDRS
jgi:hypothetical protein